MRMRLSKSFSICIIEDDKQKKSFNFYRSEKYCCVSFVSPFLLFTKLHHVSSSGTVKVFVQYIFIYSPKIFTWCWVNSISI